MLRVLLVRLGALGDIVHGIPVAAALRRAEPTARIDWLVSAKHREILDLVPVIDRRYVVEDRGVRTPLVAAIRELRRAHYDVTIDLQGLIKSALAARGSGAQRVVGFASRYLRERFARMLYTEVYDPGGAGSYEASERRHVVQLNLGLLQPLGIAPGRPEFPIERVDSEVARQLSDRTNGRYVLLNLGAGWPNKRWPPSRFAEVATALHERRGLVSAVLWGPGELDLGESVVAVAGRAAVLSPPTSIADVVAIARGAAVMVSGDTGPLHVAAAVGTRVVGLYGPTRPERNGPWHPDDLTVSRAEVCRCHHVRRCRMARMCLLDIGVDEVVRAVERRLDA